MGHFGFDMFSRWVAEHEVVGLVMLNVLAFNHPAARYRPSIDSGAFTVHVVPRGAPVIQVAGRRVSTVAMSTILLATLNSRHTPDEYPLFSGLYLLNKDQESFFWANKTGRPRSPPA